MNPILGFFVGFIVIVLGIPLVIAVIGTVLRWLLLGVMFLAFLYEEATYYIRKKMRSG